MSSANGYCGNPKLCPGGNCIGCKDGQLWCQDPKCTGQCPGCGYDLDRDRFIYVTFFLVAMAILLILFVILVNYGHQTLYYYVPNYELERKGYQIPEGPPIYC
jgi:hypothetical protein